MNTNEKKLTEETKAVENTASDERAVNLLAELVALINKVGIDGSYSEICEKLKTVIAEREETEKREQLIKSSPEFMELEKNYRELKREQDEKIFAKDMEDIRAEFDDCVAETIDDMDEIFCIARIMGLSSVEAYALTMKLREKMCGKAPVIMGRVGSSRGTIKDFYSSDELERLSKEDLDNPDILTRAINSLTRLHK